MPQRGCRMRLNKYLAQCGVCSRRDADKLIEQGKVLVNGQIAGMGQQVLETDTVQVGKKILQRKQTIPTTLDLGYIYVNYSANITAAI